MFKKCKKILSASLLLSIVAIFALTLFTGVVDAQTPEFNNHPNDHETLRLKNRTTGTPTWRDPISASPGDYVSFDVYYHNNVIGSTATNTRVRIDYPCDPRSQVVSTARISANNASTASGTGTINVSGSPQRLIFDSVAKWYPNQGTVATNLPVTQVGPCSVEVNIGSIQGCWEYQGHVVFDARLTDEDEEDDAEGEVNCYSATDNSITLSYRTWDANNASLFRGNTRITNIGSGDRSGTYRDTDLSSDRSYTYYLRDGSSSSSPELDRVVCRTSDDNDPSAELSCYSATDDSIRLSYSFTEGNNVSLFRGSSRIETWSQSSHSGRITDTDLSSNTSYTYYLRDGRFTSSTLLDRVVCRTSYGDREGEMEVLKRVKSVDRNTTYSTTLNGLPGELINYSIRVTARDGDAKDVIVRDDLPVRITYVGNLRVDGVRVTGDIERGVSIGDIREGEYKEVTFDARVAARNHFLIGTTSIVNTARVTSDEDSKTSSATVRVTLSHPTTPPTEVPTGITGNTILDYVILPFFLALIIFIVFKKQFVMIAKRIDGARRELKEEW